MKKKILIIIVGLLVAGGSSYAYFENNKEFEQPSWKEYNNKKNEISFSYPEDWIIENSSNSVSLKISSKSLNNENSRKGTYFAVHEVSYIQIYTYEPERGGSVVKTERDDSFSFSDGRLVSESVVRLKNGEVAALRLLDKKTDAIIYVGIETDVEDRLCTSYKTGESLPDSHCHSGDVPSGFDWGGYIMSGIVSDSAKKEVFNILNSFN